MRTVVINAHTKGTFEWNLLKPYRNAMTGCTMVVIQCPHCGENVELEDGSSGLFDCPYCNKDYANCWLIKLN